MSINGHKTSVQDVKERKEKYLRTSLHPLKSIHTSPNKNIIYPMLTLPLTTRLLLFKTTSPFCHE